MPPYDPSPANLNYTLVSPLAFGTYYWRVVTTPDAETAGTTCDYKISDVWSFEMKRIQQNATILTDGSVTLTSLANNTVTCDTSLNFSWNAVVGAYNYQIQIDTVNSFDGPDLWDVSGLNLTTTFSTLPPNQVYYWRVRGYNNKCTGEWSDIWNFRKEGVDLQVNLLSQDGSSNSNFDTCNTAINFYLGNSYKCNKISSAIISRFNIYNNYNRYL